MFPANIEGELRLNPLCEFLGETVLRRFDAAGRLFLRVYLKQNTGHTHTTHTTKTKTTHRHRTAKQQNAHTHTQDTHTQRRTTTA